MSILPIIAATALGGGLVGYGLGRLHNVRVCRTLRAAERDLAEARSQAKHYQERAATFEWYYRQAYGDPQIIAVSWKRKVKR